SSGAIEAGKLPHRNLNNLGVSACNGDDDGDGVEDFTALAGFNDWASLKYNFRGSKHFDDFQQLDFESREVTNFDIREMRIGIIEAFDETIQDLPDSHLPKDRKSTRLNSSHVSISYAVFCLKKKKNGVIFANLITRNV